MSPKEIKKKLNEEGFEIQRTTKNYVRELYILNLKFIPIIPIIQKNQTQPFREKQISENGIIGIKWIKTQILDYFKDLDSKDEFFKITDEVKSKFNLTETEIRDILTELLSEGLIYEPRKDVWRYLG
jgi:DNA replicative helicase MCM subunit Mcm2 (Cdc46/Mcm family)